MPRALVHLAPGKPEVIALKFARGKDYGNRVLFSTVDDRILYLDPDEARELEEIGIAAKTPFTITKVGKRHQFVFDGAAVKAPAPMLEKCVAYEKQIANDDNRNPITPIAAKLMASYMTAVDTLLETQVYAHRKGLVLAVTCEDVRCLAATIFIDSAR